ncbi:retrotransposon protein, putative, ty1-copia subclass [Tanacetum coccineum]
MRETFVEFAITSVDVVRPVNTRHRWDETCLLDIIVIKSTDVVAPISPAPPTDSEYLRSGMRYMIHNEVACLMLGSKGKANGKGKDKQVYIPKPKNPKPYAKEHPAKDNTCHHYKDVGYCKRNCPAYLAERIKKAKQVDSIGSFDCKMTRKSFPHRPERATGLLGIIHTDVCGPLRHVSRQGYPKETMGYYFYFPPENKIVVARYAEFFEKRLISQEISGRAVDLEEIQEEEDTTPSKITSNIPQEVEGFEPPQEEVIPIRSPKGHSSITNRLCFKCFVDLNFIPRKVCKLQRSIYGLKQASRSWNKRFDEEIKRFGFSQNLDEPCVYQKASGSNVTFLILYVDDIIIMGNHIPSLQSVKNYLGKCFSMKDLGEAAFILGIKIYRDRSKRLIGLSQNAYIDKILKRYKMDNSKRGHIPMQERPDLNKSQGAQMPKEVNRIKNVPYASAVGSIMYAIRFVLNEKRRLGIVPTINEPIRMFCDNSAALHFANELGFTDSERSRHYYRSNLLKVHTNNNLADPFTKALSKGKLTQHARSMGLRPASRFHL